MTHFVVCDKGIIRAHVLLFSREIFTDSGSIIIGVLGGVCVRPDYRRRGRGAQVSRAALEFLPQMNAEVSLFHGSYAVADFHV